MFGKFYPHEYVSSVFAIDYQKLYDRGVRGILFDIDNTLVHHGADSSPEVDALFRQIHAIGLKTILISNNNQARIERFIKNIDTPYVCDAEKPEPSGYAKALEILGISKEEAVCIGDQIFTDIYGANRFGIASILVQFICLPGVKKIGIRRRVEKVILTFYRLRRSRQKRLGGIAKENEHGTQIVL